MIIILLAGRNGFFIAFRCQHFISHLFSHARRLDFSQASVPSISSEVVVKIIDYKVTRQAVSDYNKYYKLSRYFANKFYHNTA
jgi:hypothetical protein